MNILNSSEHYLSDSIRSTKTFHYLFFFFLKSQKGSDFSISLGGHFAERIGGGGGGGGSDD